MHDLVGGLLIALAVDVGSTAQGRVGIQVHVDPNEHSGEERKGQERMTQSACPEDKTSMGRKGGRVGKIKRKRKRERTQRWEEGTR